MTTTDQPTLFSEPDAEHRDHVHVAVAHARATDPETSHAAAASIPSEKLRVSQQTILELLRLQGPMDDRTIGDVYNMLDLPFQSESGLRTRRAELVRLGLVVDTGDRVVLPSGRKAIVWSAAT